jgi:hypothetical protein
MAGGDEMKSKCILSAPTTEELEKLINEYYCSRNYVIDGDRVLNRKTGQYLDGVYVVLKPKARWQMRRWERDADV